MCRCVLGTQLHVAPMTPPTEAAGGLLPLGNGDSEGSGDFSEATYAELRI